MKLWEKILLGLLTYAASFRGIGLILFGWEQLPVPDWKFLQIEPFATLVRVEGSCLGVLVSIFAILLLMPYYLLCLVEVRMSARAKWIWAALILFASVFVMPVFYWVLVLRLSRPHSSSGGVES